jgi:hypothetical protein
MTSFGCSEPCVLLWLKGCSGGCTSSTAGYVNNGVLDCGVLMCYLFGGCSVPGCLQAACVFAV